MVDIKGRGQPMWDAEQVRTLRQQLGLTQQELAQELNVRQQTVSEWETSQYRPLEGSPNDLFCLKEERKVAKTTPSPWTA